MKESTSTKQSVKQETVSALIESLVKKDLASIRSGGAASCSNSVCRIVRCR